MRKVMLLVGLCLLVLASVAMADEGFPSPNMRTVTGINMPQLPDRTGDCTLGLLDPANIWYAWDWDGGYRIYKLWLDASNIISGECTEPLYPFTCNSMDLILYSLGDSINLVGQTFTMAVDVECPANVGTTYPDACNGPGDPVCTYIVTHTITDVEASGVDFIIVNVPFAYPHCFNGGIFVGVRLLNWTGADANDAPAPLSGETSTAADICKIWWYNAQVWGNPAVTSPPCWQEIFTTYVTPWGPWSIYLNVTTGADCTPIVCQPCDPMPVGDTDTDPIVVMGSDASYTVDLCDYCPDYDQRPLVGSGFTAAGGDAVFEFAFDPSMAEVCFNITLTPACSDPTTFFRIRSWISDSFGPLYFGTPTFPGFGAGQTYDFTPTGLGCLPPDVYHLYVDARGCCCPVIITYTGDETLPAEFGSFTAVPGNGSVSFEWNTFTETGVSRFELTRDNALAHMEPATNTSAEHTYRYTDTGLTNGRAYDYALWLVNLDGSRELLATESVTPSASAVTEYALDQNYPNPFNPSTSISYSLLEAGSVTLKVYTLDGREVTTLVSGNQTAGRHTVSFDASDLASGVYLYKLAANGYTATHKMVLMK